MQSIHKQVQIKKYVNKNGEQQIKTYTYKRVYNLKGNKFDDFKKKYESIVCGSDTHLVKFNKLLNALDSEDKKKYTINQIRNFVYRN